MDSLSPHRLNPRKQTRGLAAARRWAPAIAFALVACLVTAHTLLRINVPGQPDLTLQNGLQDFRDAVYYPVRALLDGRNPYDPSDFVSHYPVASAFPLYSPALLSSHVPFGWLGHETAQLSYYALHLALLPVFAWLALRAAGVRAGIAAALALSALMLLSRPGHHNAFLGQCTLYLAIGTYAALLWSTSRPWLAALGFALTTLKPTYALPLAALLLARAEVRPIVIGALLGAGAAIPAIAVLLWQGHSLVAALGENMAAFSANSMVDPTTSLYRIDAAVPLAHLLGGAPSSAAQAACAALILAPAAVAVRRLARRPGAAARRASNEIVCLAVVTAVYHLTYDGLLLALPAAALALGTSGLVPPGWTWSRVVLSALLLMPAVNYVATRSVLDLLGLDHSGATLAASLNAYACLTAFFVGVMLALRRAAERSAAGEGARKPWVRCLPV